MRNKHLHNAKYKIKRGVIDYTQIRSKQKKIKPKQNTESTIHRKVISAKPCALYRMDAFINVNINHVEMWENAKETRAQPKIIVTVMLCQPKCVSHSHAERENSKRNLIIQRLHKHNAVQLNTQAFLHLSVYAACTKHFYTISERSVSRIQMCAL